MKKISILIASTLLVFSAMAQQDAQYSQYMFNKLVINPAYAGSNEMISVGLFHRTQWVGFDDHPVTQSFSIHSPVLHKSVGVGLHVVNDRIGAEKKTSFLTSYAYRINAMKGVMSFGLQAGFQSYGIDQNRLDTQHDSDPRFYPEVNNQLVPDFGFGAYYTRDDYYVGFSIPHLTETQIQISDSIGDANFSRHYFLTAAYQYQLSLDWVLLPSFILKAAGGAPISFDLSLHAKYDKAVWGGLTYRVGDSFNLQLGTDISNWMKDLDNPLRIGYAFDLTSSKLRTYNSGTHEIMLIYDFEISPKASKIEKDIHYTSPRLF